MKNLTALSKALNLLTLPVVFLLAIGTYILEWILRDPLDATFYERLFWAWGLEE
jgi:hypothetical protein